MCVKGENNVFTGTVECIWEGRAHGGQMVVKVETEGEGSLQSFEVSGELHDRVRGMISEGDRVEVSYVHDIDELVNPETGRASERYRPKVTDVRLISH